MKVLVTAAALAVALAFTGQALAHDHLSHAAAARGNNSSPGDANPVGGNPSGVSGAAADPGTAPGGGDPNDGLDQGTPSVDSSQIDNRKARGRD